MITIDKKKLEVAKKRGIDEYLQLFIDAYIHVIQNELEEAKMEVLNGEQHTLLAYDIFRREVLQGGFCQLIQNGYAPYIFDNPFAKAMRLWGAQNFSKLIYKAGDIYEKYKEDLEKERTDEEFMAMYMDYEVFDGLEDCYFEIEEEVTTIIARYIEENINLFAEIV